MGRLFTATEQSPAKCLALRPAAMQDIQIARGPFRLDSLICVWYGLGVEVSVWREVCACSWQRSQRRPLFASMKES